jgi:hypothetical protein
MDKNLGEAPASVNFTYKRADGFIVQLTLRDETGEAVLKRLDGAINKIVELKGIPYERQSGFKKREVEYTGELCPLDKGRLIKPPVGSNRPIKCENSKYDFATKTSSGGKFIKWPQKSGFEQDMEGQLQENRGEVEV